MPEHKTNFLPFLKCIKTLEHQNMTNSQILNMEIFNIVVICCSYFYQLQMGNVRNQVNTQIYTHIS